MILHPDFAANRWIYFAYSIGTEQQNTLAVDRAHLDGTRLVDRQRLFEAHPLAEGDNHLGTRLVIQGGYLFFAMGERYDLKDKAQELDNHLGKIIRIHDDGRVPDDNPFVAVEGALPEIWSYATETRRAWRCIPRPAHYGSTSMGRRAATRSISSAPG